jgi:2'-5' RNA ligase
LAFEPHVTLVGRVTGNEDMLVEVIDRLARNIAPIRMQVTGLEHSDAYFRCVALTVELDPALAAARAEAERCLPQAIVPERFQPHLSLLYGDVPPLLRQQICDEMGAAYPTAFTVDRLRLVAGAADYRSWRMLESFKLSGN